MTTEASPKDESDAEDDAAVVGEVGLLADIRRACQESLQRRGA